MSVSAKELTRRSRAILSGRYSLPMGAFAVSQVISTCISLPFDISLQSNPTVFQFIISELATAIISLLYIVLKGGQAYVHLNMARGKNASIADVFRYFSRRPDRFILSGIILIGILLPVVLPAAVVTILALTNGTIGIYIAVFAIWAVTLIPIIVISLTYSLTIYLLVERPSASLPDIFRESRQMMKGNKRSRFYLGLSFFGMYLLCILSLGIGFLWIIPYRNQAYTEFYLSIKGEQRGEVRKEWEK